MTALNCKVEDCFAWGDFEEGLPMTHSYLVNLADISK